MRLAAAVRLPDVVHAPAAAGSPVLVRAYAAALRGAAGVERARGRRLHALHLLLRAWRAAEPEGVPVTWKGAVRALLDEGTRDGAALRPVAGNALLAEFVRGAEARAARERSAALPPAERVRMRLPVDDDPERQGDLIVLKRHDPATGERGALLVKYSESIRRFPAVFDQGRVAKRYALVLEPSWWGYQSSTLALYAGAELDVVVQAPWGPDAEFVRWMDCNLVPLRVGAGDWVDPDTFRAAAEGTRSFDVVMVSAWSPAKRHGELFAAMARLRARGRRLRAALVGYPQRWTRGDVERLARRHGIADDCTFFEGIPHAEVARVVADSRAYVLLSRREGANKALYESLFCGTPVIVPRAHRGVNDEHVGPECGVRFDEGRLDEAVVRVLDAPGAFRPREWAVAHTGWARSTDALNGALRTAAEARGLPWTHDIAAKKNAPNLRYAIPGAYRDFAGEYASLEECLR
jgi:glycosyltransferase involved in cell wall biosynthesis